MTRLFFYSILLGATHITLAQVPQPATNALQYSWKPVSENKDALLNRIAVPAGFKRVPVQALSFSEWLRNLPLKKGNAPVLLFDGTMKGNQSVHYAVVNIDPGKKDLQQCADAVMRLRAEYLFSAKQFDKIHFNFTSGFTCSYEKWSQGNRPKVDGNRVTWEKRAQPDNSYASFRKYLDVVFSYCGTQSLSKELKKKSLADIQAGDVFIRGGFPGHAVLVMDVAINPVTKEKIFLLAQSYMPAQDIHVLKNPENNSLSPWYSSNMDGNLVTPEWTFSINELMSF